MPTKGRRASPGNWFELGFDMWMLGVESSGVIALRTLKMAAGGAAAGTEAELMVSEKVAAAMALSQKAMFGQLGSDMPAMASATVADYRRKVRANKRRLTKR
jgi:hypothetical protein